MRMRMRMRIGRGGPRAGLHALQQLGAEARRDGRASHVARAPRIWDRHVGVGTSPLGQSRGCWHESAARPLHISCCVGWTAGGLEQSAHCVACVARVRACVVPRARYMRGAARKSERIRAGLLVRNGVRVWCGVDAGRVVPVQKSLPLRAIRRAFPFLLFVCGFLFLGLRSSSSDGV